MISSADSILQLLVQWSTLLLLVANCAGQSTIVCPNTSEVYSSTNIQTHDPISNNNNEISGIAFSPTILAPSGALVLYGVNDGGNGERLILWDSGTGQRLRTFFLPAVQNVDWEDLAIGTCGMTRSDDITTRTQSCLYIADTGDNKARKSSGNNSNRSNRTYQMIKLVEPVWSNYEDYSVLPESSISILTFDYSHPSSPTRSADSESIFLDHKGWGGGNPGDIYIITKWDSGSRSRLFQIPVSAWQFAFSPSGPSNATTKVYSPVAVGSYGNANTVLTTDVWFRADMATDGTTIALGGKTHTRLFLRCPGQSIADALAPPTSARVSEQNLVCHAWPNPTVERQVESFAWTPDKGRTLQVTEGTNSVMFWTDMIYNSSLITSRSSYQRCPDLVFVNGECQDATTGQVFAISRCEEAAPSMPPTAKPSHFPTSEPSTVPTISPTSQAPSKIPTAQPSLLPTIPPTSLAPSKTPTAQPSLLPTRETSALPTILPTSLAPSKIPTAQPSLLPTREPTTESPSLFPTIIPTTKVPSNVPSRAPTVESSLSPTKASTNSPTFVPSPPPALSESNRPTQNPTSPTPTFADSETPSMMSATAVHSVEAPHSTPEKQTAASGTIFVNNTINTEAPTLALEKPITASPSTNDNVVNIDNNMYEAALALQATNETTESPTILVNAVNNDTAAIPTESLNASAVNDNQAPASLPLVGNSVAPSTSHPTWEPSVAPSTSYPVREPSVAPSTSYPTWGPTKATKAPKGAKKQQRQKLRH